ncbi:ABC transporter ATP-binding protein [Micromonospora sp. NPDC007271]|uniref:ABC transporter ATP-binding protein n=1 Tax=Micromonospora sp. NPDC007271 TaxID=3154587 RepID=UPI00340B2F7D
MVLVVENLTVRYGSAQVINGVGLRVERGEIVALLGNNGVGKTTLLRALSATLNLHGGKTVTGTAHNGSCDLLRADAVAVVRSGLAHVPEGRRIIASLSVEDNLMAGALAVRGAAKIAARRATVYDLFPVLADRAGGRAGLLSGGEQQMLAIGRALMSHPSVLLLDEPSLGLAPLVARQIAATIRRISDEGMAVLLVEQNTRIALGVADRVTVLGGGRVVAQGRPEDFADSRVLAELSLGGRAREMS